MHHFHRYDSSDRRSTLAREELVGSIRMDFEKLACILAEQRADLRGEQMDCVVRAQAAVARGIELSDRVSVSFEGRRAAPSPR